MLFDFTDGKMNSLEIMLLQSEENADNIIRVFKNNYKSGDDPNDLLSAIAQGLNIGDEDLLPESKTRIENEVRNYLMRY